jgi:uncharacterized repeat protein (TIGR01451 family)
MTHRSFCLALVLAPALAGPALAQVPPPPPLPAHGPAPLLFVRFSGPPGTRTAFFQDRPEGRTFNTPVVVGLRPGYVYRVRLGWLPGHPGVQLFPTVEVRGCLSMGPGHKAAEFPASVTFTEADIESALAGVLVTKVVYLENPDRAVPTTAGPGQVSETDLPPNRDLLAEARELGRPLLIVRLGERNLQPEEVAHESVPGTVLYPGEKVLPPPGRPPCVACADRPFYDPRLGPRPCEEECIHDGGDRGAPAGLDGDGKLQGLDPEDTLAEYTDSCGRKHLTCSNRVCLCVPRFAVLRSELPLGRYDTVVALNSARLVLGQEQLRLRVPSLQTEQAEQPRAVEGRKRPTIFTNSQWPGVLTQIKVLQAQEVALGPIALLGTAAVQHLTQVERTRLLRQLEFTREWTGFKGVKGYEQVIGTAVVGRVEGLQVITAEVETGDLTVCCCETPCLPDKPLVLIKCADRHSAQVGDVVTFFLRYSNQGGRPITDVAVSDSLSGRLEYVPGSAQSDRDAVFMTQENEAGSVILRWEISGRLLPGESGALRFQARVR